MQQRSVTKVILLTLVTFGIYGIYWLVVTRREMVKNGQNIPSLFIIFAPLLLLVLVALLEIINGFVFSKTDSYGASGGSSVIDVLAIILGILAFVGIFPACLFWYYKYCKAAEQLSNGEISFSYSYGLFILTSVFSVYFIWPGIMQEGFNKLSPETQSPAQAQP